MNDCYEWCDGNHIRNSIVAANALCIALNNAEFTGNFWYVHGAIMDAMGKIMVEIEPRI